MNIIQIVDSFKQKPYLIRMGKSKISKILNCTEEDVVKARKIIKNKQTNRAINMVKARSPKAKILLFDLETSPITAYVWKTIKEFIQPEQIIRDWTILTYSAKWLNEDKIFSGTAKNEKDFNDYNLVKEMWYLLDEADIIIAHNCNRFDRKRINARFLFHGLTPPSPYKVIDTLEIAKHNIGTTYGKLDFLAKYIGNEGKMEHEGFLLWRKCMEGDLVAWDTMSEYNKKDVIELEKLYLTLRPWDSRHPNLGVFKEDPNMCCTKCGSKNLEYMKDVYTNTRVYKLYKCNDCHGWSRSRTGQNKTKALITQ